LTLKKAKLIAGSEKRHPHEHPAVIASMKENSNADQSFYWKVREFLSQRSRVYRLLRRGSLVQNARCDVTKLSCRDPRPATCGGLKIVSKLWQVSGGSPPRRGYGRNRIQSGTSCEPILRFQPHRFELVEAARQAGVENWSPLATCSPTRPMRRCRCGKRVYSMDYRPTLIAESAGSTQPGADSGFVSSGVPIPDGGCLFS